MRNEREGTKDDSPLGLAHVGPGNLDADDTVSRLELLLQLGLEPLVVNVPAQASNEHAAVGCLGGLDGSRGVVRSLRVGERVDSRVGIGLDGLLSGGRVGGSECVEVGGDDVGAEGRGGEEAGAVEERTSAFKFRLTIHVWPAASLRSNPRHAHQSRRLLIMTTSCLACVRAASHSELRLSRP